MQNILTFLLFSVILFHFTRSCPLCSENVNRVLTDTIQCKSNQTVGLAVSVVRSGEVLFVGGYGIRDKDSGISVTEDTLFCVASLSKAFASTLLLKLLEDNPKYSLNTKIKTILEDNHVFYDKLRSGYATIRDLVSHRMGIPYHNSLRFDTNLTRSNLMHRLKYLKPKGEFRGSFIYNNLMYGIITYLGELIGGESWEDLVTTHLLKPLNMTSTTFTTKADPSRVLLARGYVNFYGELQPVPFEFSRRYGELCGSTCILTTANDMAKWTRFFLNGGKLEDGTRLISEESFRHVVKPVNAISHRFTWSYKYFSKPKVPVSNSQSGYSLAWRTGHYRGYRMLTHGGHVWGYRAMLSWFPDVDLGIFIALTGSDDDYFYRTTLQNYIFDVYTGHVPYLNVSTICSYPEPWAYKNSSKEKPNYDRGITLSRHRDEYIGIFHNSAYGNVEIEGNVDRNKLTMNYGYVTFILHPSSTKDVFSGESVGLYAYLFDIITLQFSFDNNQIALNIPDFGMDGQSFIKDLHQTNGACPVICMSGIVLLLLSSVHMF